MDIYSLSRNFFDWSFENPEKIKPLHTAIFFFAIEHCNRLGWKEKFGFPTSMAMEAIGIKKWQSYKDAFNELVEWGFLKEIEVSKNQYSSCIISLGNAYDKKDKARVKALDKALVKHGQKHRGKQGESTVDIDIQVYNSTNLQDTSIQDTNVGEQALTVETFGNKDINDLLDTIKGQVEFLGFIYKKGKYERERAKNILTGKEFGEICDKANMSRVEFCKSIIYTSTLLTFWNGKINNAETLYKHYAQVYNDAVNKKTEIENRPRRGLEV